MSQTEIEEVPGWKWTDARADAAKLVAADAQRDEDIASTVGVSRRQLARWKDHPEFKERVGKHVGDFREQLVQQMIGAAKTHPAAEEAQQPIQHIDQAPAIAAAPSVTREERSILLPGMFHNMEGLGDRQRLARNVRPFKGDGSPYLYVPGLQKLQGVRVGSMELPLELTQEYPLDNTMTRLGTQTVPLVILSEDNSGAPILLRNTQSNDGIWQDGATIYVAGEWEDQPAQTAVAA